MFKLSCSISGANEPVSKWLQILSSWNSPAVTDIRALTPKNRKRQENEDEFKNFNNSLPSVGGAKRGGVCSSSQLRVTVSRKRQTSEQGLFGALGEHSLAPPQQT